jgi:hypothetical protein
MEMAAGRTQIVGSMVGASIFGPPVLKVRGQPVRDETWRLSTK